jgi:hypothetical protein
MYLRCVRFGYVFRFLIGLDNVGFIVIVLEYFFYSYFFCVFIFICYGVRVDSIC